MPYYLKIKTTGLAGGMHHAFKAMVPAARHGLCMSSPHATIFQATAEAVAFLLNYSCYP